MKPNGSILSTDFKIQNSQKIDPQNPLVADSNKPSLFTKIVPIFGVSKHDS